MATITDQRTEEAVYKKGDLGRFIKRMTRKYLVADAALTWARKTLEKANLPTEVGYYSPDEDSRLVRVREDLTAEEQDQIVADGGTAAISWRGGRKLTAGKPWVASLRESMARMGYAPGTPERDAAELLEMFADMAHFVHEGNAKQVATAAFYAGVLWGTRQSMNNVETGKRVRAGAWKGADINTDHDAHIQWLFADNKLLREGIKSKRERARIIGKSFGVPFETVRGAVRKLRKDEDG